MHNVHLMYAELTSGVLGARLSNRRLTIAMIPMTTCQTLQCILSGIHAGNCSLLGPGLNLISRCGLQTKTVQEDCYCLTDEEEKSMLEFLQENQLLWDIKFTYFRRMDKTNKLLKWCCGGLSRVLWGALQANFIEAYLFPWARW